MKTRIAFTTLLLSLLTLLTACQKEEPHGTLPAGALRLTTESFTGANGDKTSVSGNTVQWRNGDVVNINGTNYTVTVDDVNHTAYIDGSFGTEELFAYYPNDAMEIKTFYYIIYDRTDTTYTLDFPSSYDCTFENGRQVIALPMLALASGGSTHTTLQFYHTTAAINVKLWNDTGSPLTVTKVVVTADAYGICKSNLMLTTRPNPTESVSATVEGNEAFRRVEVNFPAYNTSGSLTIPPYTNESDLREVQVPIRPMGTDNLTIEVFCTDGTTTYLFRHKDTVASPLTRNQMLTARVKIHTGADNHVIVGALPGKFKVNASGKQVIFSQGNLQYIGSASTPYWKFADHQYDYLGNNGQHGTSNVADRDLFGWGCSGQSHGATSYQPWDASTTDGNYFAYGNANNHLYSETPSTADWGYNAISNGGNTVNSGWRTLKDNTSSSTDDEWNYIFNTRQTGITIGPTTHSRYTMATINTDGTSVKGIILFPDNYIGPQENTSDISWGTINNKSNWSTSCTTAGWLTLENAGCVFLPAAGYRDHNSSPAEIHNIQTNGYYSSSSYKDEDGIYYLRFGNDDVGVDAQRNGNRHGGFAVRLVKDVN